MTGQIDVLLFLEGHDEPVAGAVPVDAAGEPPFRIEYAVAVEVDMLTEFDPLDPLAIGDSRFDVRRCVRIEVGCYVEEGSTSAARAATEFLGSEDEDVIEERHELPDFEDHFRRILDEQRARSQAAFDRVFMGTPAPVARADFRFRSFDPVHHPVPRLPGLVKPASLGDMADAVAEEEAKRRGR